MSPSISAFSTSAIDDDEVDGAAAHEGVAMSSACSPVSGCEIRKLVDVDAELLRVDGVERACSTRR